MTLRSDGSYLAAFSNGKHYAFQPGYTATPRTATESLGDDGQGRSTYVDPQGRQQVLYPVAADFAMLENEMRQIDPAAALTGDAAGQLSLTLAGLRFTLIPDYQLVQAPVDKLGKLWWIGADSKLYVRVNYAYANYAQGFVVMK